MHCLLWRFTFSIWNRIFNHAVGERPYACMLLRQVDGCAFGHAFVYLLEMRMSESRHGCTKIRRRDITDRAVCSYTFMLLISWVARAYVVYGSLKENMGYVIAIWQIFACHIRIGQSRRATINRWVFDAEGGMCTIPMKTPDNNG